MRYDDRTVTDRAGSGQDGTCVEMRHVHSHVRARNLWLAGARRTHRMRRTRKSTTPCTSVAARVVRHAMASFEQAQQQHSSVPSASARVRVEVGLRREEGGITHRGGVGDGGRLAVQSVCVIINASVVLYRTSSPTALSLSVRPPRPGPSRANTADALMAAMSSELASGFREMSLDEDGGQSGEANASRDEALEAIGNDNVLSALAFLDLRDLAAASTASHAWSGLASSSEALWTAHTERVWEGKAYVVPSLVKMAGGAAAVAVAEEEERAVLKTIKVSELKAKARIWKGGETTRPPAHRPSELPAAPPRRRTSPLASPTRAPHPTHPTNPLPPRTPRSTHSPRDFATQIRALSITGVRMADLVEKGDFVNLILNTQRDRAIHGEPRDKLLGRPQLLRRGEHECFPKVSESQAQRAQ